MILQQSKNITRKPNGHRWSKEFIGTCLQIFNKSSNAYDTLINSKILLLPSESTLIIYRNKIKQEPGINSENIEWMFNEANKQQLNEESRQGGIVFDEMAIPCDLQIDKKGDVVELCGLVEKGEESDVCTVLRSGKTDKKLGTHVLQFLFLSVTGFRFPFAHFITDQITASELYSIFWKSVQLLWSFGFKVVFTCMDGAVANRSFMHQCMEKYNIANNVFKTLNPVMAGEVIFIMDFSHVMKKIRNNILKSGINQTHKKLLTLQKGQTIQWQMFIDVYNWDQQNALFKTS